MARGFSQRAAPSAFGTSPKYDKGNLESSSKLYIVVFGGGWVGAVLSVVLEKIRVLAVL
jgi:hypothetical protein